jgi:hypothetical protein
VEGFVHGFQGCPDKSFHCGWIRQEGWSGVHVAERVGLSFCSSPPGCGHSGSGAGDLS